MFNLIDNKWFDKKEEWLILNFRYNNNNKFGVVNTEILTPT